MDNFIKTDDKLVNIHGLGRVGRFLRHCVSGLRPIDKYFNIIHL
jgi:hypothetical protein